MDAARKGAGGGSASSSGKGADGKRALAAGKGARGGSTSRSGKGAGGKRPLPAALGTSMQLTLTPPVKPLPPSGPPPSYWLSLEICCWPIQSPGGFPSRRTPYPEEWNTGRICRTCNRPIAYEVPIQQQGAHQKRFRCSDCFCWSRLQEDKRLLESRRWR